MGPDLQTKVEKYQGKASRCEASAQQAPEGAQRKFYLVLAEYYGKLATDFRQIVSKRNVA